MINAENSAPSLHSPTANDIRSEERVSEPRRNASRISERFLTYDISLAFVVFDDIMGTELFSINMDKKIVYF